MKKSIPKTSFLIAVALLVIGCADLKRDNMLDPGNPNAQLPMKIVAEAFVNDSTGFFYSRVALSALEDIGQMESFADNLLILQYHIAHENWNDPFECEGALERYHRYVKHAAERGIPDVFFNGREIRVQGATSESVKDRYLTAISNFEDEKSRFRIVGNKIVSNNQLELDVQIAKMGKDSEDDIIVQAVLVEDPGIENHRAVVRKILSPVIISRIHGGEVKSFNLSVQLPGSAEPGSIFAVVMVQKADETLKILQAEKF